MGFRVGWTELTFKYSDNKNHVKTSMIAEFVYNLRAMLEARGDPPYSNHRPPGEPPGEPMPTIPPGGTTPCLNVDCEWISYFLTYYTSKLTIWPLPADPSHPRGHCKVCKYINEEGGRRSHLRVTDDRKVVIARS
jgi:hypothetical protein